MGRQGSQPYTTFLVDRAEQIATVRLNRTRKNSTRLTPR